MIDAGRRRIWEHQDFGFKIYTENEAIHILYLAVQDIYEEIVEGLKDEPDIMVGMLNYKETPAVEKEFFTVYNTATDKSLVFNYSCFHLTQPDDVYGINVHLASEVEKREANPHDPSLFSELIVFENGKGEPADPDDKDAAVKNRAVLMVNAIWQCEKAVMEKIRTKLL